MKENQVRQYFIDALCGQEQIPRKNCLSGLIFFWECDILILQGEKL